MRKTQHVAVIREVIKKQLTEKEGAAVLTDHAVPKRQICQGLEVYGPRTSTRDVVKLKSQPFKQLPFWSFQF
jgi:hypothetical protein